MSSCWSTLQQDKVQQDRHAMPGACASPGAQPRAHKQGGRAHDKMKFMLLHPARIHALAQLTLPAAGGTTACRSATWHACMQVRAGGMVRAFARKPTLCILRGCELHAQRIVLRWYHCLLVAGCSPSTGALSKRAWALGLKKPLHVHACVAEPPQKVTNVLCMAWMGAQEATIGLRPQIWIRAAGAWQKAQRVL